MMVTLLLLLEVVFLSLAELTDIIECFITYSRPNNGSIESNISTNLSCIYDRPR
jgi:hypothetical protein